MEPNEWAYTQHLALMYEDVMISVSCKWKTEFTIDRKYTASDWGKSHLVAKEVAAEVTLGHPNFRHSMKKLLNGVFVRLCRMDGASDRNRYSGFSEEDDTAHDALDDDSPAPNRDSSASNPNQDAESGVDVFHDNTDNHASSEVAGNEEDTSLETDSSGSGDVLTTDRSDSPGASPLDGDTSEGLSLDFSRSECYAGGSIGCGNRMDTQIAHYHLSGNVPLAAGILISTASFQWKFRSSLSSTTISHSPSPDARALPALSMAVYASKVVIPKRWGSTRKSVKHFGFMMAALSMVLLLVGVGPG
jgi:hypothetical protein